jgi:hypothetical protein
MIPHEEEWDNHKYILHKIYPHTKSNQIEQKGLMFAEKKMLEEADPNLKTHYTYYPEETTYALYRRVG